MEAIQLVDPVPPGPLAYTYIRTTSRTPNKCLKWVREHEPLLKEYIDDQLGLSGVRFGGNFRDESDDGLLPIAKRPAGSKLMERLSASDWVVVWDFEHAFQNQIDLTATIKHWDARGVNWSVFNMNIPGVRRMRSDMILYLLLELARFENKMAKFAGDLSLHPMHSTLIGIVGSALERGDCWTRISGELNGRGLRTRIGKAWSPKGVQAWWRTMRQYGKRPADTAPSPPFGP